MLYNYKFEGLKKTTNKRTKEIKTEKTAKVTNEEDFEAIENTIRLGNKEDSSGGNKRPKKDPFHKVCYKS